VGILFMKNQEQEIWKAVKGYEGLYEISNTGKIKGLKKGVLLKHCIHKDGYFQHSLSNNGKAKNYLLHRLLAINFIPNPNPDVDIFINHIDANRTNNELSNLEWCTHSRNVQHGYDMGNHKLLLGDKNGRAKKVINKNTGQIFTCAKYAHKEYGKLNYRHFMNLLCGVYTNNTGYEYYNAVTHELRSLTGQIGAGHISNW
jgi:hypothetical protein